MNRETSSLDRRIATARINRISEEEALMAHESVHHLVQTGQGQQVEQGQQQQQATSIEDLTQGEPDDGIQR